MVPLPKELPVTVCGAIVLLTQVTIVPGATLIEDGLKANLPFLSVMIETVTLGGGGGVGVGDGLGVGVGDGRGRGVGVGVGRGGVVGVGVGRDRVGVGVGVDCDELVGANVGVEPALVGVSVGALEMRAVVGVGVGLPVALPLLPPQAVISVNTASPSRQDQANFPRRDERGKRYFGSMISPFS